ncbi:MAG: hypothetical protein QF898_04040 [SAR202 cluster bacterium]|jgi:hypothetical protein|nr:hypothetical protein [SAR202 cluster bacterium]MDP6513569.1 hypothetical protein [SAR202 cluster bacterium]MDP6714727.1 hypothetical protein [SAR202 cluster bacterium]
MTTPTGAHLVGSVPLSDSQEVFRTASSILGDHLLRIPDGETGERSNWIGWQSAIFYDNPVFETVEGAQDAYRPRPQAGIRDDAEFTEASLGRLGYADAAIASYQDFVLLKEAGDLPSHIQFQVSLPTPLAPVSSFVSLADRPLVEPVYESIMLAELAEIIEAVPRSELAIQWDVAVEFSILEGIMTSHLENAETEVVERLVWLGAHVPEDVSMGYHLCYGDAGHRHFKEPEDTSRLAAIANALSSGVARNINWIHMPVPRDRSDDAYFQPLTDLSLQFETELYLGLVHFTDGVDGAQRRIETAQKYVSEFGVATECGFGRRPPETVADLMEIHAAVSAPR